MTESAAAEIIDLVSISCSVRPDKVWRFAAERADDIDANWQRRRAQNPHLYDGSVILMDRTAPHPICDGGLEGSCFVADYKAFLAWRDFGFPDPDVANLFAMAALESADGAFLLGEMGAKTAAAGRIYFPAGTPDLADIVDGGLDLEASVLRELKEETGFGLSDIACDPGWTVVFHGAYIACMKTMRLALTAAEAIARAQRFIGGEKDPELAGLRAVFSAADIDVARMPEFVRLYMEQVWAHVRRQGRG